MRPFDFHPEARAEYLASIAYYGDASIGLGTAFANEVEDAIALILSYPSAWPALGGAVRRCMLGRFPCGIIYTERDNGILILAVAHAKRAPGYWRSRQK